MRAEAAVTTGRWVRLLLLFCTLVGLAAMHTLGHGTHTSPAHSGHAASDHHAGAVVAPVPDLARTTGDCPVDDCGNAVALPLGTHRGDLSGWAVCLAVLGALAVALVVVLLLRTGSRVARPPAARPRGWAVGPRSPPPRPVGLRLATASVLRR